MKIEFEFTREQLGELADMIADRLRAHSSTGKTAYTPEEAAKELGISARAVRNRINAGTIKRVPNMPRMLVPASEMKRLGEGGK